jgi:hypothetical protein
MDYAIKNFLEQARAADPGAPVQILSLGAGFDTTYFRLKAQGLWHASDVFYEIDFPTLVARKHGLIQQSAALSQELPPAVEATKLGLDATSLGAVADALHPKPKHPETTPNNGADIRAALDLDDLATVTDLLGNGLLRPDYRLVGSDLCNMKLAGLRLQAAGLRTDVPTLVFSECVLTYVGPKHARAVRLSATADN